MYNQAFKEGNKEPYDATYKPPLIPIEKVNMNTEQEPLMGIPPLQSGLSMYELIEAVHIELLERGYEAQNEFILGLYGRIQTHIYNTRRLLLQQADEATKYEDGLFQALTSSRPQIEAKNPNN